MNTKLYAIKHTNNRLEIFLEKDMKYSSEWFMDFGKFGSEVFNLKRETIYSLVKKFKFWKWKMVFTIKKNDGKIYELISKNNKKTIYSINIDGVIYDLKIHYKKRISIYKSNAKIAEFDASFSHENFQNYIKLQLSDANDLEIVFLLFSCIQIGETDENVKKILPSQKELETNEEPWS